MKKMRSYHDNKKRKWSDNTVEFLISMLDNELKESRRINEIVWDLSRRNKLEAEHSVIGNKVVFK